MTVPLFGEAEPAAPGVPGEQWAVRQFEHRNLRIGHNRTVHRTALLSDGRGVAIPVPDCHAGYFAAGRPWWQVYSPTTDRVDCGLCLNSHRGHPSPDDDARGHQLMLDLVT